MKQLLYILIIASLLVIFPLSIDSMNVMKFNVYNGESFDANEPVKKIFNAIESIGLRISSKVACDVAIELVFNNNVNITPIFLKHVAQECVKQSLFLFPIAYLCHAKKTESKLVSVAMNRIQFFLESTQGTDANSALLSSSVFALKSAFKYGVYSHTTDNSSPFIYKKQLTKKISAYVCAHYTTIALVLLAASCMIRTKDIVGHDLAQVMLKKFVSLYVLKPLLTP